MTSYFDNNNGYTLNSLIHNDPHFTLSDRDLD